jgi:HAD superfamily hydrolase (TIGR01509 family)
MRRLFQDAGETISSAESARRAGELRVRYQALRRAVPGAGPFLRYAHRRAKISIVTNNLLEEQREKLRFLGLSELVDDLVTSEEIGVAKPDPAIFRAALERSGADPRATVVFGDSYGSDVLGAQRAGLPVVWFNRFRAPIPPGAPAVPQLDRLLPAGRTWVSLSRAWRLAVRTRRRGH